MRNTKIILALVGMSALAGCLETDGGRALTGAAAGAIIADATDNNALTGAAIGAGAGALCDDAGICRRSY
ncbi:hypothetical protein [Frigidibacter oleivorans]|uniref:hypothetical protein n=1 Tax=Frigidibacter oleivorans TaxID=2487129 RepID=UPI000F8CF222|nr:hypothetical protein [Frigidibacter oleivorans]